MRSQHILQIFRHLNMWLLKYELWQRTAHDEETSTLKCILPLDKWHIIMLCLLWWKTNENVFSWLLQNYNTFSKHKMLNLSFKTFFIHILAK